MGLGDFGFGLCFVTFSLFFLIHIHIFVHTQNAEVKAICLLPQQTVFPLHCLIIFHIFHIFTSYKPVGDEKSIFWASLKNTCPFFF